MIIPEDFKAPLRKGALTLEEQQIIAVAEVGLNYPDVVALWYGEGDLSTADKFRKAAIASLDRGETFYEHKRGIPQLRQAIADYSNKLSNVNTAQENSVTLTASGMTGINMVYQAVLDYGCNMVIVTPLWPNAQSLAGVMGVEVRTESIKLSDDGTWVLNMESLKAQCDENTRAIFVNSPNNPSGWVMSYEEQKDLLVFARARGIWIIADEVYQRIIYDRPSAPSFLAAAKPDDPLLIINSFSKAWAMTGWRVGWIHHPVAMTPVFNEIIELTYSSVPSFVQYGALEAIKNGEDEVKKIVDYCAEGKDLTFDILKKLDRITVCPDIKSCFYAFFKVDNVDNSFDFTKKLVRENQVGLAPGTAFGKEWEGWLRLCFAQSPEKLTKGLERLEQALSA